MSDPTDCQHSVAMALAATMRILLETPEDAYILLTSYLHVTFDHLSDRTVEMMLIYIVTHAWESRAARREARRMDLNTRYQLEAWADMHRDPSGIHISVTPRITMTPEEWTLGHLLAEQVSGLPYQED